MDQGGTGTRAAVYGTPYGLRAMWFAVIDRDNLTGSIRNGVMSWTDRTGKPIDLYNFSVHHDFVGREIWRTGTLYLFRQEEFTPISFYPGGPTSNVWASESARNPLARLSTEPADFPIRDRVGGHVSTLDVQRTLTLDEGNATIEVRGPDGFLQAYTGSLRKSGVEVEP